VYEGAVAPWKRREDEPVKENFVRAARNFDFPVHTPVADLTKSNTMFASNNYADRHKRFLKRQSKTRTRCNTVMLSCYRGRTVCPECEGYRLRKEALYIKVGLKQTL